MLYNFDEFVFETVAAEKKLASIDIDASVKDDYNHVLLGGISAMKGWFYGALMGEGEDNKMSALCLDMFQKISKQYHKPLRQKIYRIVHLRTTEDPMKVTRAETGMKRLQSWSSTILGARWFFHHFAASQNHRDIPTEGKTWVLLSADIGDVEQLLTFEECIKFLKDCRKYGNEDVADEAADLIDHIDDADMNRLHEVICSVTNKKLPVEVLDVLVPDIKDVRDKSAVDKKKREYERQGEEREFDNFIRQMMVGHR